MSSTDHATSATVEAASDPGALAQAARLPAPTSSRQQSAGHGEAAMSRIGIIEHDAEHDLSQVPRGWSFEIVTLGPDFTAARLRTARSWLRRKRSKRSRTALGDGRWSASSTSSAVAPARRIDVAERDRRLIGVVEVQPSAARRAPPAEPVTRMANENRDRRGRPSTVRSTAPSTSKEKRRSATRLWSGARATHNQPSQAEHYDQVQC